MTARLTKARLKLLMESAKEGGGHVDIDLETGKARVVFGRPANEHGPSEDLEAQRLEETMKAAMGGKSS